MMWENTFWDVVLRNHKSLGFDLFFKSFLTSFPTLFLCQVRSDWATAKINVMYRALKCKFSMYPHLNSMLLSTAGSVLVEGSPHDLFWGGGREGEGLNHLGRLLMQLRSEFLGESSSAAEKSLSQLHNL